ncbi:hypothetical protein BJY52DRAFT_1197102 [Lactarius psammicola]|nr:hypothetical protein BJY52DRAFT_1197102 [Lactarius psammicola]
MAQARDGARLVPALHAFKLDYRREVGHAHRGFGPGLKGTLGNPATGVTVAEEMPPDTPRDGGACGVPAELSTVQAGGIEQFLIRMPYAVHG